MYAPPLCPHCTGSQYSPRVGLLGTWYKFRQILEYLLANAAEYILFIDCDAFIMLRQVSGSG